MKKRFRILSIFICFSLLFISCSNTVDSVIAEDSGYRSVKSTTGTISEGTYSIELGEAATKGVIKRTLSYGLTESDGQRYAFSIIKNTDENHKISYQAMAASGKQGALTDSSYTGYSITAGSQTIKADTITVTSDSAAASDGYYYLYMIGSLKDEAYTAIKKQTGLTITFTGNSTVSFTVPYAFMYGLSAYL